MSAILKLGAIAATPGAMALLDAIELSYLRLLDRHALNDWGDLDQEDKDANTQAVIDGSRILSAYQVTPKDRVWIITEADRSTTTILLPEEY